MSESASEDLTPKKPDGRENVSVPKAKVERRRRWSLAWLVPTIVLGVVGVVAFDSWRSQGMVLSITFESGHGIRVSDPVRFRGIEVGHVTDVTLVEGMRKVAVRVLLDRDAADLAASDTRFWVVRPQVSLSGVEGLETLLGSRYIAVSPGGGAFETDFIGLDEPPIKATLKPGGTTILLQASRRGGLRAGAPLLYRQIQIGSVISVGLSEDASAVEIEAYVEREYTSIVRDNTLFWNASGLGIEWGLMSGIQVNLDSMHSLLVGGVAMVTPTRAGDRIESGHRFVLHDKPDEDWLKWEPLLPIGRNCLPKGVPLPKLLPIELSWRASGFLNRFRKSESRRSGWGLMTEFGVLGPVNVLEIPTGARDGSASIAVGGTALSGSPDIAWKESGLMMIVVVMADIPVWPKDRMRWIDTPEDCVIMTEPNDPRPLVSGRLEETAVGREWRIK